MRPAPPKITVEEDATRGRFLLVVPGHQDTPTNVEFYPIKRPMQYHSIEPDDIDGVSVGWKGYCGYAKHVSTTGSQHFVATFLHVPDNKFGTVGPQLTNGHEFVVDPSRSAKSQFHSEVVFVENADEAMRLATQEAEQIVEGLRSGNIWTALEKLFYSR